MILAPRKSRILQLYSSRPQRIKSADPGFGKILKALCIGSVLAAVIKSREGLHLADRAHTHDSISVSAYW